MLPKHELKSTIHRQFKLIK